MALEIKHCVKLGESQQEYDRSLCASASFSQVIGEALHTPKNCSKLLLKANLISISKERGRNLKPKSRNVKQQEEMTYFKIFE